MSFAYTVRTTLPRGEAFDAWVTWLVAEHVAHVCEAGAADAEIVVLDEEAAFETRTVEVRYRFSSREAFATYERVHAPRLRAAGLAKLAAHGLAPGAGVTFTRTVGDCRPWRPHGA